MYRSILAYLGLLDIFVWYLIINQRTGLCPGGSDGSSHYELSCPQKRLCKVLFQVLLLIYYFAYFGLLFRKEL